MVDWLRTRDLNSLKNGSIHSIRDVFLTHRIGKPLNHNGGINSPGSDDTRSLGGVTISAVKTLGETYRKIRKKPWGNPDDDLQIMGGTQIFIYFYSRHHFQRGQYRKIFYKHL